MTYEIVPTKEEHIEGFWKVLDSVARERKYISFFEGPPMERFQTFVLGNIEKRIPQFVALADGKVVGWCDIKPSDRPVHAHCGELGMGLMAGYREQGIGSALMQTSLDAARAFGLTRVSLTVYEGNTRALEFYKKFGFRVEGTKRKDALINSGYVNVISMALLFENQNNNQLSLQPLTEIAIPLIVASFAQNNWSKPSSTFEAYFREQEEGERLVWLAYFDDQFAGYATLKWESKYQPFKDQGIPEIMDLNVLPPFRDKGIGSKLLKSAEHEAFQKSSEVGLGVGLYQDYGRAQQMYVNQGYIPDGKGITYNYKPVAPGESLPLDDNLVIWFTKRWN